MKVYLVRHGETEANAAGVIMGQIDTPLTENGLVNARQMARECEELVPADHIYCSDLGRARITADIIAEALGLMESMTATTQLRELDYGNASMKSKIRIAKQYPKFQKDPSFKIPNGESYEELQTRTTAYLIKQAQETPFQNVLVVTHHGVIKVLAAQAQQEELSKALQKTYSHQSILEFTITNQRFDDFKVLRP